MEKNQKPPISKEKLPNTYARYTGIAFKMIGIVVAGLFAGIQLDKLVNWKFPVFTLVLILFSVVLSMYTVIKEFTKKP